MTEFTCLALSPAGKVPKYGHNDYHIYNGKTMHGIGWYCDESKVCVNTWDGGREFAAHHWNRKYQSNGIDAPSGWRWAELEAEMVFMGGRETIVRKRFVGFYTEHPDIYVGGCIIDYDRYIYDLKVFDLTQRKMFDMPITKIKRPSSHIYANESWCTDGAKWIRLNVYLRANKYVTMFQQLNP